MPRKPKSVTGKLGLAGTLQAASGRTGLPLAFLKKAKADGWTCFKSNGTIDCDALIVEAAQHADQVEKFADIPDKRVEDALLTRARRQREEQRLAVERKDLIPLAEARRDAALCILATKMKFMANVDSVTSAAAMKLQLTAGQIEDLRKILHDATVAALKDIQRGEWLNVET